MTREGPSVSIVKCRVSESWVGGTLESVTATASVCSPFAETTVPDVHAAPSRVAETVTGATPPVVETTGVTARPKTAPSASGWPDSVIERTSCSP